MFTQLIDLSAYGHPATEHLDIHLSVDGFITHLQQIAQDEDNIKREMFAFILNKFLDTQKVHGPLDEKNLPHYTEALFYIYSLLVPPLTDEHESLWALGYPLGRKIVYGTAGFYERMNRQFCNAKEGDEPDKSNGCLHEQAIYGLILEQFYDIPAFGNEPVEFSSPDEATGLPRYFAIHLNNRFVKIAAKGNLPPLNYGKFKQSNVQAFNWQALRETLPLSLFSFTGFSIITIQEITAEKVVENIRNILIRSGSGDTEHAFEVLHESLQVLTGNPHLKFGLSPIFRLNNKPTLDQVYLHGSILPDLFRQKTKNCAEAAISESYLLDPQIIVYNIGLELGNHDVKLITDLSDLGITSYVCIPLHYNNHVTGLLEVYTDDGVTFDKTVLAKLRKTTPLLAQLLYDQANHIYTKIESVIKDKFTSLQPAVQWKFNQVAYDYLKQLDQEKPKPVIEHIQFQHVYPLYGAIDIKNSTIERNRALIADYRTQLQLLKNILQEIRGVYSIAILEEMEFNCDKWLNQLHKGPIDMVQMRTKDFIENEVWPLLQHFKEHNEALAAIIERYEAALANDTGSTFENRRALEKSMHTINTAITGYLDLLNEEIQRSYPCYFEKFRTDGVEYDIYIGQSITPHKPFDALYLKNVRLWQLSSMAAIAKITHNLLDQMETPLETTQLIFINGSPIDISFRVDERRFDVEGTYNIRYHVIKKRIDKVHIKNSSERLTQPGKIALVYSDPREIKEYKGYIQYLQSKDILLDDMEELELEELQGVNGLRAIRIGVKL